MWAIKFSTDVRQLGANKVALVLDSVTRRALCSLIIKKELATFLNNTCRRHRKLFISFDLIWSTLQTYRLDRSRILLA
jgi:hypothetical protein